jgi:hypothetical protein
MESGEREVGKQEKKEQFPGPPGALCSTEWRKSQRVSGMNARLLPILAVAASLCALLVPCTRAADGPFRHVVCFKFKDGTPAAEIAEIEKAFGALKGKIDTIIDYEWGTTENIEPLNDGFTHCFLVTFKDKKGLEAYLPHPDHEAFVALLKPKLDKVFVFDYTAK